MRNITTTYKWAYLPFVFSSAAILATQAVAAPSASQQYKDAKQTNQVKHEYVGGKTQIGVGVTDEGDVDAELNQVISESDNHSTGVGLWAGYDLKGDDKGILGRGAQINHNWVARDKSGRATHVNKVFAAYDRNEAGHDKATVGYGRENKDLFWEGRVSKGLSDAKQISNTVSERVYDWGVGASVGKFLPDANMRIRAGLDHEWSDKVGAGEKDARNTTLSAGIEKFIYGTGHSISLDVAGSKKSGGYEAGTDDSDFSGRLGYRYDFGGASVYQPDRRYRRVRVEVPGKATPPRYAKKTQYKRVETFKNVPVYGQKTVKKPYKQLVKSTMELEGQTFFKLNSSKLIPSAQARLKQIAAQIRKSGYKGSIRITGNTCGLGDPVYDQILSEKRANEVKKFLIANGFNPDHLIARGLGKGHPKYPRTPDQDFKNRRVDIEYVAEHKSYKTGYRTETQRVQTGTRRVSTGFKNVPAGTKNVMIDSGKPGAPRVIWKTEAISTSPAWIKRALRNNIKHDRNVNVFQTSSTPKNPNKPKATSDKFHVETCSASTINVLNNDHLGAGSVTVAIVNNPSNGTLLINSNNTIEYTPTNDFVGADSFTYQITDAYGNSSTADVEIAVTGDCLVDKDDVKAADDSASTNKNEAVTINVLNNDDADASITRIVSGPANGTAMEVNGQIVYAPNSGFTGTDTFVYEVRDPNGNIDTARVTVLVNGKTGSDDVNAADDSKSALKNTPVKINVLSNDDADASITRIVSGPANGTAMIMDGQVLYTPNNGFTGNDSFVYEVTDPNGNLATATVTIRVYDTDDSVKAANDSATTDEGQSVTVNVLNNDDADATITRVVTGPSNGSTSIINGKIVYSPNAGFTGQDSFVYEVKDPNGNTATATVTIKVNDTDDGVKAVNDSAITEEGQSVTVDVLKNDDADATITRVVSGPSNGSTSIVNGKIVYTPNAGFKGQDSFVYEVTDPNGNLATATVTITVKEVKSTGVNAEPDDVTINEGEKVRINVLANDAGSGLTITRVDTPSKGTARISGKKIVYTANPGETGMDSFWYEIKGADGGVSSALIVVDILKSCHAGQKCH